MNMQHNNLFVDFHINNWKIEKVKYNFTWMSISYKNQIALKNIFHKLQAMEDLEWVVSISNKCNCS